MGMYLSAVKKVGDNYEHDYRWDDSKWSNRYEFFELLIENAEIDDRTQPYSDAEVYYRPKNIEEVRAKIKNTELDNEPFNLLLDLLEKDKNVFVMYE